ncbi:MAG: carboxypeptidase-like regulatory domain-containing protein [Bacteroidales bacterium]|nr:carboxypeptidase-like regulatory domain-containing protein [Bacteroidales bacterium]
MKIWTTTFCILFLLAIESFGQNRIEAILEGKVTGIEKTPLENVHIINLTKGIGTISGNNGKFKIQIESYDTVLFSSVGFHSETYIVADLSKQKVSKEFVLLKDTIQLKEIVIYPYPVTIEALKRELLTMEIKDDSLQVDLHLENVLIAPPPETGVIIKGPITALYEKFSRNGKLHRLHEKNLSREKIQKQVVEKYNADVVAKITGLMDEFEIKHFMEFCNLQDEFILHASTYELYLAISDCYKDFNKATE